MRPDEQISHATLWEDAPEDHFGEDPYHYAGGQ
jgi:hypothetical protein